MTGLLVNALNFLPIGRLDGGRVVMSIAGRQAANSVSALALAGVAISFITNASPIFFFFGLIIIFLQRGADIPPLDDVTPVVSAEDEKKKGPMYFLRALALAVCVSLTSATVIPQPPPFDVVPPTTTSAPSTASSSPMMNQFAPPTSGSSQSQGQSDYPLKMAPVPSKPVDVTEEIFKDSKYI
jgi:hypothetical protein